MTGALQLSFKLMPQLIGQILGHLIKPPLDGLFHGPGYGFCLRPHLIQSRTLGLNFGVQTRPMRFGIRGQFLPHAAGQLLTKSLHLFAEQAAHGPRFLLDASEQILALFPHQFGLSGRLLDALTHLGISFAQVSFQIAGKSLSPRGSLNQPLVIVSFLLGKLFAPLLHLMLQFLHQALPGPIRVRSWSICSRDASRPPKVCWKRA